MHSRAATASMRQGERQGYTRSSCVTCKSSTSSSYCTECTPGQLRHPCGNDCGGGHARSSYFTHMVCTPGQICMRQRGLRATQLQFLWLHGMHSRAAKMCMRQRERQKTHLQFLYSADHLFALQRDMSHLLLEAVQWTTYLACLTCLVAALF